MKHDIKFTHTIDYIDVDGAMVLLPSRDDIERLTVQLENADAELAEAEKKLAASMAKKPDAKGDSEEPDSEAAEAVKTAQDTRDGLTQALGMVKAFREKYRRHAKLLTVDMHRYGFMEEAIATEAARKIEDDRAVVNQAQFMVTLLRRCIDDWSLDEEVTEEAIGALPTHVVQSLYDRLVAESVPSAARLAFHRVGAVGSPARKSRKS